MSNNNETDELKDEMFGYAKLARHSGIKVPTLYSLVSRRQIPHIRISKRLVLFSKKEIDEWFQLHSVATN